MADSLPFPSLAIVLSTAILLGVLVHFYTSGSAKQVRGIPHLQFEDGNNSPERYIRETKPLLHIGYEKYTKNGIPFTIRNPIDPVIPLVILPWKYLDEVKSAPTNKLSFPLFSNQAFLLDYNHGPQQTPAAALMVKTDLNKHLGDLLVGMQEECTKALTSRIPECKEWTPFQPYMTLAYVISKITSRALACTELAQNEEWVNMNITTTMMTHQAALDIRAKYTPRWRWLARWRDPGAIGVLANKKRAAELVGPILQQRQASSTAADKKPDGFQWLINLAGKRGKKAIELADEELFLGIASIHSTSASILSILYDLIDHPDATKEIMAEVEEVRSRLEGGAWTKTALMELGKLDSFMKESQRVHPLGCTTVQRTVVQSYTFKDGFQLPQNAHTAFPNLELNLDETVYEDAASFRPWRFLEIRKRDDPSKFHFTYVSEKSINFGAGTHACPGRFFASAEIKLALIHILTNYDVQWPNNGSRPPNMSHDFAETPNFMVDMEIRRKTRFLIIMLGILTRHPQAPGADSDAKWIDLSRQVGGNLHPVEPLPRPCFSNFNGQNATVDGARCTEIQDTWLNATSRTSTYAGYFHSYGDNCISDATETCALDLSNPTAPVKGQCRTNNMAQRYIEITGPQDAQAAFKFAKKNKVALSIKSSGHDYLSRSSGKETLALWTRNLKGMEFHRAFRPKGTRTKPVMAVTVGSGINANEATVFAGKHGVTLLTGASGTVTVAGGWSMFGGHSVLSPKYGLGADRILEINIVTPDGEVRTCNSAQNQDLFWALRGAGGGAFGVVLNATMKAEPAMPVTFAVLAFAPTPETQDTFFKILIENTPNWSSDGWGGIMSPLRMTMIGPHIDQETAKKSLAPAIDFVKDLNGTIIFQEYKTYYDFFQQNIAADPGDIGQGALVSFRVLPKRFHQTEEDQVSKGLAPTIFLTTPAQYNYADNSTSVHPAWRDSYWDIGFTKAYSWNATNDDRLTTTTSIQQASVDLAALAPDGAAYPNEADPWIKDWQKAFWGDNYAPLAAMKAKYDPEGLLHCWKCIGFEDSWIQNDARYSCMATYEGLVDY
ncbi:cytochrome P450 [Xylaria palmicola]|nr:cytochrome P450 [Xylaria palmicola]